MPGWLLALLGVGLALHQVQGCLPSEAAPALAVPTEAGVGRPGGMPTAVVPGAQVTAASTPTIKPTPLPLQPGDMNVLLLGTDRRRHLGTSWRTDTIMVAAVRPRAGFVALFSIPRDLWVTIPGYGEERINVADCRGEWLYGPGGGPRLVAAILQDNVGIPIHGYVRIHFEGLERVIDALGGVTLHVDRSYDWWTDSWDQSTRWHFQLSPGIQRLDGRMTLTYARDRNTTNDLDRTRRQQQVLLAMREAALQPATLWRLPALVQTLWDTVETDIRPEQVPSLLRLGVRLKGAAYRTRVFDGTMVRDWTTPGGAMVLLPDWARIRAAWAELTAP